MQRKGAIRTITAVNPLQSVGQRPPSRVHIVHPKEATARIELSDGIVAFGRSQGSKRAGLFVEVPDDTVSRNHFAMAWVDDTWLIKDLGSRNGTWVDGVKV